MSAWVWIQREVIVAIHEMQLAEHGGLEGVRDADRFLVMHAKRDADEGYDLAEMLMAVGAQLWRHCWTPWAR